MEMTLAEIKQVTQGAHNVADMAEYLYRAACKRKDVELTMAAYELMFDASSLLSKAELTKSAIEVACYALGRPCEWHDEKWGSAGPWLSEAWENPADKLRDAVGSLQIICALYLRAFSNLSTLLAMRRAREK